MNLLSPQDVADYLRSVGITPNNTPGVQRGYPAANTDGAGDGYWQRWGSVGADSNQYSEQDPWSFPEAQKPWLNSQPYDEATVFNASGNSSGGAISDPSNYATPSGAAVAAPTWTNPVIFTPFPFSFGTASVQPSPVILSRNYQRCAMLIQNLSVLSNLYVSFGAPAAANLGIQLVPGGGVLLDVVCPNNDVYGFFPNAVAQPGVAFEGSRSS